MEPDQEDLAREPDRWITHSEEETREVGRELARRLAPSGVALLSGDLGAGKTVLARGVAEGLGIDPREVQSPTYTLMREHEIRREDGEPVRLVHLDLYRLAPEETLELGLEEVFARQAIKVVEWAERWPLEVPGAVRVAMRRLSEHEREVRLLGPDEPSPPVGSAREPGPDDFGPDDDS